MDGFRMICSFFAKLAGKTNQYRRSLLAGNDATSCVKLHEFKTAAGYLAKTLPRAPANTGSCRDVLLFFIRHGASFLLPAAAADDFDNGR